MQEKRTVSTHNTAAVQAGWAAESRTVAPGNLEQRWTQLLTRIIPQPRLHARLLNTLSLLEHIGCRKIVKALHSPDLDLKLLQHIAEEARHAYLFKRLAERVAPGACPDYHEAHLLGGRQAQDYIQGLDHGTHADLRAHCGTDAESLLAYLVVTTLIEERAGVMYGLYEAELKRHGSPLSLAALIQEEQKHLDDMQRCLHAMGFPWPKHAPRLRLLEAQLFETWLQRAERESQPPAESYLQWAGA